MHINSQANFVFVKIIHWVEMLKKEISKINEVVGCFIAEVILVYHQVALIPFCFEQVFFGIKFENVIWQLKTYRLYFRKNALAWFFDVTES